MAINALDIQRGVDLLREQGARLVLIFGTAAHSPDTARDIDLAAEGIPPERFYRVVGMLLDRIGKPVDLIDLSVESPLTRYVRSKGRVLYERR